MLVDRLKGAVGNHLLRRLPARWADPLRQAARRRRHRRAVGEQVARGLPIVATVSPHDEMLVPRDPGQYFRVGASALAAIERSLAEAGVTDVARVCDVPCGHGRVLRYLRARWPDATITACDLNRHAVDFCVEAFGAVGVYSADPISGVPAPTDHDLVWVGSLLTHLDAERWPPVLRWLRDRLRPGGALVVSTHGVEAARRMVAGDAYGLDPAAASRLRADYAATGFGYAAYPWDPDYGVSLSTADWVRSTLAGIEGLEVVSIRETAWADHHDVVTLRRTRGEAHP